MKKRNVFNLITKKPLLTALFYNVVAFTICLLIFVPRPMNNDDYLLNMLLGTAYGEGTSITVYTNILFGEVLRFLYSVFPSFNFITITEWLLLFCSFSCLTYVFLKVCSNQPSSSLIIWLVFFITPTAYLSLHYTKVAIISTFCGALAIYFSVTLKSRPVFFVGLCVLVVASFLRFSAFLFGMGTTFFVVLALVLFDEKHDSIKDFFQKNKKVIFNYLIALGVVSLFFVINTVFYSTNEAAREYKQYLDARVSLSDYSLPDYETFKQQYQQLGLSQNDIALIEDWSFSDLEFFSTETLQAIANIDNNKVNMFSITEAFAKLFDEIVLNFDFLFISAVAVVGIFITSKKYRYMLPILYLGFLSLFLAMCAIGRTTRWVNDGLVMTFMISVLVLICANYSKRTKSRVNYIVFLILPLLIFNAGFYQNDILEPNNFDGKSYDAELFSVYNDVSGNKQNLYLFDLLGAPAVENAAHVLVAPPTGIFENVYFLGGWDTGSTVKNAVLENYEVDGSPYRALVQLDNVFLVDSKSYDLKHTFLKQHIADDITMSLVDIASGYYVFGFSTQDITFSSGLSFRPNKLQATESPFIPTYIHIEYRLDNMIDRQSSYLLMLKSNTNGDEIFFKAKATEFGIYTDLTADIPITALETGEEYSVYAVKKTGETYVVSQEFMPLGLMR